MNKPLLSFLIISAIFIFYSCGAKSFPLSERRYLNTGMDPKDAITIVLNKYNLHEERNESEGEEKALEKCVMDGMADEKPILKIIPAKEFRKAVYPALKYENAPRSQEALKDSLKDEAVRNRITDLRVRYIVTVDINTDSSDSQWGFEGNQAVAVVSQSWARYSHFGATIIDAKNQTQAGYIAQASQGHTGWFLGVLVFVPVPGFLFSRTEADACSKLGLELQKFLLSNAEPNPIANSSVPNSLKRENQSATQYTEQDRAGESPSIQNER